MRNRFVAALFLTALLAVPHDSHAGWVTKEIGWQISSVGSPTSPTGIFVRDTLYTVVQGVASELDTTNAFSLKDARPIPRGVVNIAALGTGSGATPALGGSGNDTTIVAWIVIQADSSAAGTATLSAITCLIDGKAVPQSKNTTSLGLGWVKADSALVNTAASPHHTPIIVGNESVAIPIRTYSPYGSVLRWAQFRARFTAVTGILSGSVRAFVHYWSDSKITISD